ncbi:hypothetical protein OIO90_004203 [Microbotryomycetes sp. JL221]|nr:hypothetical protein OIO90_004203 [Microbotryomycetes sp. JL221]
MSSTYGTRRASAAQAAALNVAEPISIVEHASSSPSNSALFGTSLSSSAGRQKRPTTIKQRRMSSSTSASGLRSPYMQTNVGLVHSSLPATATSYLHAQQHRQQPTITSSSSSMSSPLTLQQRGRSTSQSVIDSFVDLPDDGEIKPGSTKKHRGETYICEKCNKEHTAHWKEASKLLLSKHQQVQLLEAAAILKAASSGASLPDEKSYWPAAVSPPSSGLLGSDTLNIHTLTSPRFNNSLALIDDLDLESEAALEDTERDDDDEDDDEDGTGEETGGLDTASNSGDDALDEGMFDLDLGATTNTSPPPPSVTLNGRGIMMDVDNSSTASDRSRSVGRDSGFGSLDKNQSGATLHNNNSTSHQPPTMGFFKPQNTGTFVR